MGSQHDDSAVKNSPQQQQRGSRDPGDTQRVASLPEPQMSAVALRERVDIHEVLGRVACAMLQPCNVVTAACRDLAPFFANFRFTIAVYFPETQLFVIHTPGAEPKHIVCDETIEGYFLHHTDEDVLAIEDQELWTPPPPLNLTRWAQEANYRGGLFAASRIHNNLVGVVGLQSASPFAWDAREVEMLRAAATGFGLAYYHAVLSDNLIYSCREASQRLQESQQDARDWRHRAEQLQTAADIARNVGVCHSVADLLAQLTRVLGERWPNCRVTIQRYLRERDVFEVSPVSKRGGEITRPVRSSVQKLFLNNVPVTYIVCDSPQEIATYGDLDPQFVAECEAEGFASFCSAPIFVGERLWGTVTLQARESGACSRYADLLAEICRVLVLPVQVAESNAER